MSIIQLKWNDEDEWKDCDHTLSGETPEDGMKRLRADEDVARQRFSRIPECRLRVIVGRVYICEKENHLPSQGDK